MATKTTARKKATGKTTTGKTTPSAKKAVAPEIDFEQLTPEERRAHARAAYFGNLGCKPWREVRQLVEKASGQEQPLRGVPTVVSPLEMVYVWGYDHGDSQLYVPLDDLLAYLPAWAAIAAGKTWAGYAKLDRKRAVALKATLREAARWKTFRSFRSEFLKKGDPAERPCDDEWDDDDKCEWTPPAVRPTEEVLRARWEALSCFGDRPPQPTDEINELDMSQAIWDGKIWLYRPETAMSSSMPSLIEDKYAGSFYDMSCNGPFASYDEVSSSLLQAAFRRLGYLTIRDDDAIRAFFGTFKSYEDVIAKCKAYRAREAEFRAELELITPADPSPGCASVLDDLKDPDLEEDEEWEEEEDDDDEGGF
jgi:hypothetical protein